MFPKNKRIPRKVFPLLTNGAKAFKNNLFFLKTVSYNGDSRFCFSVSKKVAKSAVVRNRLRRTGYRILSKYLPEIKSKVLVVFSYKTVPISDEMVDKNLKSILKESNLIQ
jgi:ribonuclease P protein component